MAMKVTYNEETQHSLFHMNKNIMLANKSLMKLSSGQKINSAGDNPSTYSISERMRERIRSLDRDVLNVQNGTSMLSTAERGVNQIVEVLRSMKALAVNAADDHNTDEDRAIIQMELESRRGSINDIVFNTKFNNKVLLDGRYDKPNADYPSTATHIVDSFEAHTNAITDSRTTSNGGISVDSSFVNQNSGTFSVKLDFSNMSSGGSSYPNALHGKGFSILCSGCTQFINVVFDATKNVNESTYNHNPSSNQLAREYIIGVKNVTNKSLLPDTIFEGVAASRGQTGDSIEIDSQHNLNMLRSGEDILITKTSNNLAMQFKNDIIPTNTEPLVFEEIKKDALWIQDGTLAGQHINTYIKSMETSALKGEIFNDADLAKLNSISDSTERIEYHRLLTKAANMTIDDISLATREDARVAMRVIDGALDYALDEQTTLGAYVKRLNYVDENIMKRSENLQETDSNMRDTDIPKEMTTFVKYSILTQAAQFMLAQINQNGASVLNLLE